MRQFNTVAAAVLAALALSACDQLGALGGGDGRGPALPQVQPGATPPSNQAPAPPNVQQGTPDEANRQQLIDNIGDQLDQIQANFAPGTALAQGFSDQIFTLQPSTDQRYQINLTGGQRYTFVGACDGDCTNVDIELIDMATGGVVASDMLPDDYPVANFEPPADGSYMVRFLMQNCTVAPCFAGFRALALPASAGEGPK